MIFSYDISKDRQVDLRISYYDLLIDNPDDRNYVGEGIIAYLPKEERLNGNNIFPTIYKDNGEGRYYIQLYGEKIYLTDYKFFDIAELNKKIINGEYLPMHLVASSIIKNADKIAFIEKRMVPDMVYLSINFRSYSNIANRNDVICAPIENHFHKLDWGYRIETAPISAYENDIYGREVHYISDFCSLIHSGSVKIISRDDIDKYDINNSTSYVRKRKKKD